MPYPEFLKSIDFGTKADPTEAMSGTQKFLSGAGKAFVDVGRGAKQITGLAPSLGFRGLASADLAPAVTSLSGGRIYLFALLAQGRLISDL
jgi:hypothetical protein